jgi:hypothetical protein
MGSASFVHLPGSLLGLFFYPEDRGNTFLRNHCEPLPTVVKSIAFLKYFSFRNYLPWTTTRENFCVLHLSYFQVFLKAFCISRNSLWWLKEGVHSISFRYKGTWLWRCSNKSYTSGRLVFVIRLSYWRPDSIATCATNHVLLNAIYIGETGLIAHCLQHSAACLDLSKYVIWRTGFTECYFLNA